MTPPAQGGALVSGVAAFGLSPSETAFLLDLRGPGTGYHLPTAIHEERVAHEVHALSIALGFDTGTSAAFAKGALVHDIGKALIPAAILDKPGRLTDEEMAMVRRHAMDGERLLDDAPGAFGTLGRDAARHHHERWDGSGYHGLKATEIPLIGRIVSVCDVWEAMTSTQRPYKKAIPPEDTLLDMTAAATGRIDRHAFDPDILRVFVALKIRDPGLPLSPRGRTALNAFVRDPLRPAA